MVDSDDSETDQNKFHYLAESEAFSANDIDFSD